MKPTKIVCIHCGSTNILFPALVKQHSSGYEVMEVDKSPILGVCDDCGNTGARQAEYDLSRSEDVEAVLQEVYELSKLSGKPATHPEILEYVLTYLKTNEPHFWGVEDVGQAFHDFIKNKIG